MSSDAGCRHLLSPLILPSQNLPFWAALVPSFFYLNIVINVIGQVYTIVQEWKVVHLFSSIKWRCCKNSLILAIDSLWMLILNWKMLKSSGWVNGQSLPATTLFQNYSGAAQICHLLRRTLKLWSRGRSAVFFGWKIYFRRCRLQIFVGGGTCCMWRPCNSWLRSYFTCLGRRASITSITVVTKLRLCRKPPTMELRPSKTSASIRGSTGRS